MINLCQDYNDEKDILELFFTVLILFCIIISFDHKYFILFYFFFFTFFLELLRNEIIALHITL